MAQAEGGAGTSVRLLPVSGGDAEARMLDREGFHDLRESRTASTALRSPRFFEPGL